MIKSLYKSFVPYLLLLVMILIAVFIFDNYAERVSEEPEVILLGEEKDEYPTNLFSWQLDNEIALRAGSSISSDSLFWPQWINSDSNTTRKPTKRQQTC